VRRWICASGLGISVGITLGISLLSGSYAEYVSAARKAHRIESDRWRRTRVTLTLGELNSWVKQEIVENFPQGLREPRLVLSDGGATGSLLVDFGKVRRAQGNPPGWLMSKLIDGERPVEVMANIRSGNGHATVDVIRVTVSGVVIEGRLLDFLIQYYLLPNYPEAKVGEPFDLAHGIDRLDIKRGAVDVVLR
jgi:hypothetical protein